MAILAQIDNLTKTYGDRTIVRNITFGINQGDKIGIIAKNGTGKSTLMRIIAGKDSADSGTITLRNDTSIAYLPQTPEFDNPDLTAAQLLDPHTNPIAGALRIDYNTPIRLLSGGQRKRIAIAQTLAHQPQLLLLDEPTNHLDIDAIEALEKYLQRANTTLLMVTHDRYFLDRVCSKIIEIDLNNIYTYDGNYDNYLRRRAERINALTTATERARNLLRREQQWMSRQPQARAGKAQYRIDQYYQLKQQASQNYTENTLNLTPQANTYIGKKIFEARHISKAFGERTILHDFNYDFARGEKIGIIGPNGAGKTTFVKMLLGLTPQDSGEWNVGETVRFGYYSQEGFNPDKNKRIIDVIRDIADNIKYPDRQISATQLLKQFLFDTPDQQKRVSTLSGGELARLHLATVLIGQPNFLILDEPTNDLDIVTLGILEEYLAGYSGCAIIISHDRYFLDNIIDHLFVLKGDGTLQDYPGTYTQYRESLANAKPAGDDQPKAVNVKPKTDRIRRTYKQRLEYETLTVEIEQLTAQRRHLEEIFAGTAPNDTDSDIPTLSQQYDRIVSQLDEKELRWLELSEIPE